MPVPKQRSRLILDVLLGILLLCAATEFLLRGPVRFAHADSFNDYVSPYVQTRAWMRGQDPYSLQNLVRFWPPDADHPEFLTRELADGSLAFKRGIPTAYPLSAFALNAPFACLPWHVARKVWLLVLLLSFVVTVASVASAAKLRPGSRQSVFFFALVLALAPFHTALAAGSIVTVAVAASAGAVWAAGRERQVLAGSLLAVAVALKPQIGLPFLFYYVVRKRWRIAAVGSGVVAVLLAGAAGRLAISGTPWLQSYLYDNRVLFAPGSLGDFTEKNPLRFGLINFQVAAYAILQNRAGAMVTAFVIATVAGIAWLLSLRKRKVEDEDKVRDTDLLSLSALAIISLLPIYHRFYDATLLIFPLAWSLTALRGRTSAIARGVLLTIIFVFLVPGAATIERLQAAGHFASVRNHWWWNMFVLPHASWSIVLLTLLLLCALRKTMANESRFQACGGHA